MKKNTIIILAVVVILIVAGIVGAIFFTSNKDNNDIKNNNSEQTLGENQNNNKNAENNNQKPEETNQSNEEVTMEALMGLDPAYAGDFSWFGEHETGYTIESYRGNARMLALPEEINGGKVVGVDNYVFGHGSTVEAIRFNDSMVKIRNFACIGNEKLKIIVMGSKMKEISYAAFQDCTLLEKVVLNEGLEVIDEYAFFGCIALKSVTIPSSVTTIDLTSFMYCHEDFTIHGKKGSYAETYAKEQNIPFVAE